MHSAPPTTHWWRGPVEQRGKRWAEAAFRRTYGRQPWPPFGGMTLVHAARVLADILPTTEMGKEMISACYEAAKARYEELVEGAAKR
jgi:hypothetical protein